MPTLYNRIQGRNVDRLAALSDGIFAGAMTLLARAKAILLISSGLTIRRSL